MHRIEVHHFASPFARFDLEKRFQEFVSENLLTLLRERPCLDLIVVSCNFQVFASRVRQPGIEWLIA